MYSMNNYNNYIPNAMMSMPYDNYSRYFLSQINKIRTEPQSFIGVIEDSKANITKDRQGRIVYNSKINSVHDLRRITASMLASILSAAFMPEICISLFVCFLSNFS